MRRILIVIMLFVCTSLTPNKINLVKIEPTKNYEQEIKEIELIMLRSEKNLDEVSLIIENPKELKKVQKRFKKQNINLN